MDTSVLLPMFAHEPRSAAVLAWLGTTRAPLVTAAWAEVELASAIGRLARNGELRAEMAADGWARARSFLRDGMTLVAVGPDMLERASQLALAGAAPLRAGDALHLAAALIAGATAFAVADRKLARAAEAAGLEVRLFA